jgi:hypothetical protein
MSKPSVFILAVLLSAMQLPAQVHFKLGPIVGMNSTDLSTNSSIPYAQQTIGSGIAAGLFARLEMGKWYIQPEYLYVTESSTLTSLTGANTNNLASDINFSLKGYNANLLVGYELFKLGELANVRGFAGLGQFMNNNDPLNYNGIVLPQSDLKNGSTNVIFGIGSDILKFTVDLRYIRSVTQLYTSSYSIATNVFLLSVGIKFF